MRKLLKKKSSTKAERIFYELLKTHRANFQHRVLVNGREVDFIIGKYAIEIDGHDQDPEKNDMLIRAGYLPVHFNNQEIRQELTKVEEQVKKIINNYV